MITVLKCRKKYKIMKTGKNIYCHNRRIISDQFN